MTPNDRFACKFLTASEILELLNTALGPAGDIVLDQLSVEMCTYVADKYEGARRNLKLERMLLSALRKFGFLPKMVTVTVSVGHAKVSLQVMHDGLADFAKAAEELAAQAPQCLETLGAKNVKIV